MPVQVGGSLALVYVMPVGKDSRASECRPLVRTGFLACRRKKRIRFNTQRQAID